MEHDGLTLTGFILNQQSQSKEATGSFSILLSSIQLACKAIGTSVRKAGILGMYGLEGTVNVQGEEVKKLDLIANDNFISALTISTQVATMVSEENEEPIFIKGSKGKYAVVFDPLDGSSNIDCNVSVGSIFGIYKRPNPDAEPSIEDVLQPGSALVAAGYCMYGSSTQMVLTFGEGVHVFTLDPSVGEFILTLKDVRIPENPKTIYSVNEGNSRTFPPPIARAVEYFKHGTEKAYSARYVGSMVSDVHRSLLYGGWFAYPAAAKPDSDPATWTAPNAGKLRTLYEAFPMSLIFERAGGVSSTGVKRILDIVPTSIHERTPIVLGCKRDVDVVLAEFAKDCK